MRFAGRAFMPDVLCVGHEWPTYVSRIIFMGGRFGVGGMRATPTPALPHRGRELCCERGLFGGWYCDPVFLHIGGAADVPAAAVAVAADAFAAVLFDVVH